VCDTTGFSKPLAQNVSRAVAMYRSAAALGNASAQFTLGVLYAHGLFGLPLDEGQVRIRGGPSALPPPALFLPSLLPRLRLLRPPNPAP
jgi:hypothetical protein